MYLYRRLSGAKPPIGHPPHPLVLRDHVRHGAAAGRRQLLATLSNGEIELRGRLPWSSNATFLVAVRPPPRGPGGRQAKGSRSDDRGGDREPVLAIYKPARGERPLWDFPRGLWKREVAAYELSAFLGWGIVPPTTARADGSVRASP